MTTRNKVSIGDLAPDFTLPDQWGKPVRLRDVLGEKTVVLYFYPKDETPGCTIEARAFRDSYEQFSAKDAQVVGVSSDSVRSHRRFAQRHNLPFLLLSDRDGAVRRLYGVEKTLGLLPVTETRFPQLEGTDVESGSMSTANAPVRPASGSLVQAEAAAASKSASHPPVRVIVVPPSQVAARGSRGSTPPPPSPPSRGAPG